jgi:hypothetical protein
MKLIALDICILAAALEQSSDILAYSYQQGENQEAKGCNPAGAVVAYSTVSGVGVNRETLSLYFHRQELL